jgi:hypothetical protein
MARQFTAADGPVTADMIHCRLDHLTAAHLLFESDAGISTPQDICRTWAWNCS